MPAVTITWDPTSPAGSDALNAGDDAIRAGKTSFAERARNGGHSWDTTSGPTVTVTDGLHCCGVNFTASGSESAHEFRIYDTDKTTTLVSFRGASFAATPSEAFFGANKVRTTGNVTAATGTFSGAVSTGALTTSTIVASGIVAPEANNTRDLGIDTTGAWRDLFVARNAKIGGTLLVTGIATFTAVPVFSAGVTFSSLAIFSAGATMNGTLTVNDKSFSPISPLSTTRAVASNERVIGATLTGNITLTLPAAASSNGRELWISIISAGTSLQTVTIDGNASETIDGNLTIDLRQTIGTGRYNGVHIICDGSNWTILSAYVRT